MNKLKKLNKKGQFFSLLVVIIIILLALIFYYKTDASAREDNLYIERVGLSSIDNFVSEFDKKSVPEIISAVVKPAVAAWINKNEHKPNSKLTKQQLEDIMKDGKSSGEIYLEDISTNKLLEQAYTTLTTDITSNAKFDYILEEIEQTDYDKIEFKFEVEYKFEALGNIWIKEDKIVIVEITTDSLKHPKYNYQVITKEWDNDISGNCFAEQIFKIGEVKCTTKYNQKPKEQNIAN